MTTAHADLGMVLAAVGTPSQPKLRPKRQLDRSNVRSAQYLFTQTELTDAEPQPSLAELPKLTPECLEQSMAEMEAAIYQLKDSQMKEMQGPRYLLASEDTPAPDDAPQAPEAPESPAYLPKRPGPAAAKGKGGRKISGEGASAQFLFTPSELIEAHRRGIHLASTPNQKQPSLKASDATDEAPVRQRSDEGTFLQRRGVKLDGDLRSRMCEMEELERDLTPRGDDEDEDALEAGQKVPTQCAAHDDTAAMVRDLDNEEVLTRRIGLV